MTVTFALSETDLKDAARLYIRARVRLRRLLPLVALCAFWAVYDKVQDPDPNTLIAVTGAVIGLVLVLVLVKYVVLPFLGARNARALARSRLIVAEQHLTPTDEGFDVRLSDGHQRYLWSDFTGLAEDRRMMLLFQVGNVYRPLPKRAFTAEQGDSFLAAARANIAAPQGFGLTLSKGLPDFFGSRRR